MELFVYILIVILLIVVSSAIVYLQCKTKFFWKTIGFIKWIGIIPELKNIRSIHDRIIDSKKKICFIDKYITKTTKKDFYSSKQAYDGYINFCREKHLKLPAKYMEYDILIDTTEDALLSTDEALDKELDRIAKKYTEEYEFVTKVGENLYSQRQEAINLIEEIESFISSISNQPQTFKTEIHDISIEKKQFKSVVDYGREQTKSLKEAAKNLTFGTAAGAATAYMGPSIAMWVATTFGTASTGTAISALSGAAASNAALAWLGGGAIATGGGGMAAGQALLALAGPVGVGVATTSILFSVLMIWKNKKKIRESKKEEIVRLKNCTEALKEIGIKIEAISDETLNLHHNLFNMLSTCSYLRGCDYTSFSDYQKEALGVLVNNTKALSALLNKIITE
ncbi:hypothetical protein [Butyrivibrio fibrisolvens]|uniref:hypothetical protein n=1 Tax=Butyrivibrio fibrisolvens TaxID=831 RepID=UPI00040F5E6F|nr:hypothetical protein [Butyrivibrio fibrisolvens]